MPVLYRQPALLRTLPLLVSPHVPSNLTGTIAGNRHYSTSTTERHYRVDIFVVPVMGFEVDSPPPPPPAYASGAQAGETRLSGSTTLSLPAPGVRFKAAAISAPGSVSTDRADSWRIMDTHTKKNIE